MGGRRRAMPKTCYIGTREAVPKDFKGGREYFGLRMHVKMTLMFMKEEQTKECVKKI